jgi:biofilm PGA synthesis protein PgaA
MKTGPLASIFFLSAILIFGIGPANFSESIGGPIPPQSAAFSSLSKLSPPRAGDPSDPDYLRAIPFLKAGKYQDALPHLEKALRKTSPHPYVKADYLLCLIWTEAYESASHYYLRNEQDLSPVSYATRHAARAFYETSDFLMAQNLYEKALRENPDDLEAFKGLAYSLTRQGNFSQAHTLLDENAGKLQPPLYLSSKAWVFHVEGKYREAYSCYGHAALIAQEEWFLKEVQDRRKDLAPALGQGDAEILGRDERYGTLLLRIFLMDTRQHGRALADWPYEYQSLPFGFLLELGWSLYQSGRNEDSLRVYQFLKERWPRSCLTRIGMVHPLAAQNRFAEAHKIIDGVIKEECFLADALFAKAFLYEQEKRRIQAIAVYDQILKVRPGNVTALNLKIRNLSDMGATSLAADEIRRNKIQDPDTIRLIAADSAVDQLRWEKPQDAKAILEELLRKDPTNRRLRYDYIATLRKLDRMEEVIDQYEKLQGEDPRIPSWVTEACADAHLYLKKPERALPYYKTSLAEGPRLSALIGLFYAYQEMRDWKNAEKTLQEIHDYLQRRDPERWPKITAVPREGWFLQYDERLRPILDYYEESFNYLGTKGWYLIYQDNLAEAGKYFPPFMQNAGMASAFRMGQAHTYLWSGRPRLALEEFEILQNTDPEYAAAGNGLAVTLNQLNYKREARELAQKLYDRFPTNVHIRNTYETFKVEDMYQISLTGRFVSEHPGAQEYWLVSRLTEPVTPTFKLFQEVVWQKAQDDQNKAYWNRAGVGAEWIVFPELIWRQALTLDYAHIRDWGYYTNIRWWPTDPLRLTLNYDSFSMDIPLRARAQGIEGQAASLHINYYESDLRNYGVLSGVSWFSDKNQYTYGKAYLDQNVYNRPDFKIRLGGELYYGSYRNQNVDYFSPSDEFSLVAKAGFYLTHYQRYDQKFLSALYPRIGVYKQSGFSSYPVGGVTYEQVIETSKTFSLIWNISWDRKIYDGESTSVWSGSFNVRKNF